MSSSSVIITDEQAPVADGPILAVRGLGVEFNVDNEWVMAAEDVSYEIHPGEILAIVGESGSGKSMSSMALLGLLPRNGRSTGSAKMLGRELIGAPHGTLQRVRGNE